MIVWSIVTAEPDARDEYTNLRVEADKLIISAQPAQAMYGDRLKVEGKL